MSTTLCPRCGAPIPWDGQSTTVHCPFCQIVVTPSAFGAPPMQNPAMVSRPSGGSGAGMVLAIVGGIIGFLVLLGGLGSFFLLRAKTVSVSAVTIATSVGPAFAIPMPTAGHPGKTAALRTFGEEGNGPGQLSDGRSIAVDMDENVYVADYSDGRVQKLDPSGKFQWIIQVPKNTLSGDLNIFGMAVDTKNVLWVAREGDLLKYATVDGKSVGTVKGDYDSTWFQWIAIDPLGNIATTHNSAGNSDILFLDPSGKVKKRIKNKEPAGLAIDGAGNVYWSDRFANSIEVLDPTGNIKAHFGSKKDAHLSGVDSLAVDGKGHLFAATSEGVNVFDQGGAYLATIKPDLHGATRSIAISAKNHLFVLGGDKVGVFDLPALP